MHNFTPQSAFIGGIIIGFAVLLFFFTTGRLAGVSGIFANAFISKDKKTSNWLFLIGLVLGPLFIMILSPSKIEFSVTNYFCFSQSNLFYVVEIFCMSIIYICNYADIWSYNFR